MEKVAIPRWENRISPVLDTATRLLVVELNGKTESRRETYNLIESHIAWRAQFISRLRINTMLCGALSRPFLRLLVESGIQVYPWITGQVQDVLDAYLNGDLANGNFALPGCRHGRHRRGRRYQRHGHMTDFYKRNRDNSRWEET
jgi:predicted Fe-Mo cluster-binding NifX family protein